MIVRDQHFGVADVAHASALQDPRRHEVSVMRTVAITAFADAAMMHSVTSRSLQRQDPLTEFRLHGIVVYRQPNSRVGVDRAPEP